jgi:hypothetical protein
MSNETHVVVNARYETGIASASIINKLELRRKYPVIGGTKMRVSSGFPVNECAHQILPSSAKNRPLRSTSGLKVI